MYKCSTCGRSVFYDKKRMEWRHSDPEQDRKHMAVVSR